MGSFSDRRGFNHPGICWKRKRNEECRHRKKIKSVRKGQLVKFKKTASLWGQFNAVVIYAEHHLNIVMANSNMKLREQVKEELIKIASQMSPPPKFPW